MTKPQPDAPEFEKEVVRLPDGRELTYYRFSGERPQAAAKPRGPAPKDEER